MNLKYEFLSIWQSYNATYNLDSLETGFRDAINRSLDMVNIDLFDYNAYLSDYPDVRNAFVPKKTRWGPKGLGFDPLRILNHYFQFGRNEGRTAYCIRETGEKVLYIGFDFENYNRVCETAYYSHVNNELNGSIHYLNQNPKPKLLNVKSNVNIFEDPSKNEQWVNTLKQEWLRFDAWKYKVTYKKSGSAKTLFIDYIDSKFTLGTMEIAQNSLIQRDTHPLKICIIYVYYERKNEQKNQTNLAYFIKYGLDRSRWRNMDITTLFIINGHQCELLIPEMKNTHILYNDNEFDTASYKKGIHYFEELYKKPFYHTFNALLLMNCGMFGPIYEDGKDRHWIDPYITKLTNSVICSPCINFLSKYDAGGPGPRCQSYFSLIKMDQNIYNLLLNTKISNLAKGSTNTEHNIEYEYVFGNHITKHGAILHGEYGLTRILLDYGYNISCLVYDDLNYHDTALWSKYSDRIDRLPDMSLSNFNSQVFVKNYWRINNELRDSLPCYYDESIQFANSKLNFTNIYSANINIDYDYELLNISNCGVIPSNKDVKWENKKQFYDLFGYAEEHLLWPKPNCENTACVIYCHYDADNIVKDYVIHALKTLIILEYDIFFCTSCSKINNVDLPFEIRYFENLGCGTDFKMITHIFTNECLKKYKWINLLNDSIVLPIHGIENMKNTILQMRNSSDFWGLYESNEIAIHICSNCYFEISYKCLEILTQYYITMLSKCNNRTDFIQKIELNQTQYLIDNGFTCGSVVSYKYLIPESHSIMFHPKNINFYLSNVNCFGIKWKYLGNYMNYDQLNNPYLNYLMRYLKLGEDNIPNIPNYFEYVFGRPQIYQ